MCTAVVWPVAGGYFFAFNRDELLSRPKARPPQRHGDFLAPIDPEGGGTWIATNIHGLTLAALNVYEAAERQPLEPVRSRGLLVTDLADAASLDELGQRVRAFPHLAHTRPFHLLAVAADQSALDARWNGADLTLTPATLPLLRISAAFDQAAVAIARNMEFQILQADLATSVHTQATLRTWFASHALNGASRGVCMHREPFAATVSHTLVEVAPRQTTLHYLAGPPCQDVPAFDVVLPRS
jgi:hypothetical protein